MNAELRTAFIAAVSSIITISLNGWFGIFGQQEKNSGELLLEKQKLESELVLKVRDYTEDEERQNYLCFIVKTGIVKSVTISALSDNGINCQELTVPGPPTSMEEIPPDPQCYKNSDPKILELVAKANALVANYQNIKINNDLLEGSNVEINLSNTIPAKLQNQIDGIMFHSTCQNGTITATLQQMSTVGVSVHVLIDQTGKILQSTKFSNIAIASRATKLNPKGNAGWIHVELIGECDNQSPPTIEQIAVSMRLVALLKVRYNIRSIIGHYDVNPSRRGDPGPLFPMQAIQDHAVN